MARPAIRLTQLRRFVFFHAADETPGHAADTGAFLL